MKVRYLAIAGVSAAALAFAAATPASARWHHDGGGALAAGIIGGVAAGALIGGAVAGPYYADGPVYYEAPPPVAYEPYCHFEHERVWVRGFGYRFARVRVCD